MAAFDDLPGTQKTAFSDMPSSAFGDMSSNPTFFSKVKKVAGDVIDASSNALNAESEMMSNPAVGEAALGVVSGATSWIPAGLSMTSFDRRTLPERAKTAKDIQETFTYEPPSKEGKLLLETIMSPLTAVSNKFDEGAKYSQKKYDEASQAGDKESADKWSAMIGAAEFGKEAWMFVLPAIFKGIKGAKNIVKDTTIPKGMEGMSFEPGAPTSITPEVGRIVHPEYVKKAFVKDNALPELPAPANMGEGFITSEPKPKTILRKGVDPDYTIGQINPDLVVEKKPFADRFKPDENKMMYDALSISTEPETLNYILSDMKSSLEGGTKGGLQGYDASSEAIYAGSGYPEWFTRLVKDYSKDKTSPSGKKDSIDAKTFINIIDKGLKGDKLTPRQRGFWEDVNRIADYEAGKSYAPLVEQFGRSKEYAGLETEFTKEGIDTGTIQEAVGNAEETLRSYFIEKGYEPDAVTEAIQQLKSEHQQKKITPEKPQEAQSKVDIPSNTDPLIEEAKKYKTAEEFVKAQGSQVYHGTDAEFKSFDLNKSKAFGQSKFGHWFSETSDFLNVYGKNTIEAVINVTNPKTIGYKEWNKIRDAHAKDGEWFKSWKEKLIEEGYDGLKVKGSKEIFAGEQMENPTVIAAFNDTQVKTKAQLTSIWNKAQEGKGDIQPNLKGLSPEETFTLNNPTTEISPKLPEQGTPKNTTLLPDERGSFSLKYKDDIRDILKQTLPKDTVAGKVNAMFDRTETKRGLREQISYKNIKDSLVRSMVDVSGNLKREVLKKEPTLGKQVVMDKELVSGASAKASSMIADAGEKIFEGLRSDQIEMLNRVIQSRRIIDIDSYKTGIKHPEGLTGKEHAEYLAGLEKINPEIYKDVNARADEYFKTQREQITELQKEGILTPESAKSLIEHEYSPRKFFQYLDPEHSFNLGGRKITVPDSGIKALDEGSLQLLENNSQKLLAEVITRTQARIFRNRANKSLYEFAGNVPDNGVVRIAKEVSRTKDGKPIYEDTPGGFEKVKVMIDGQVKEMIMPWEMAQEWVKTDPLINQTLATVIGTISGAKILRPIATGYNPAFALTNMARDIALVWSSTMEYSKHLPVATGQIIKDLIKVSPDVMRRKGVVKEYIDEGGGMTFMTHYGRFSGKGFVGEKLNSLGNIMGWIGETSEIWTRMALRERALKNGSSPKEATWIARRYLDFNQGGNVAKGIDTAVPYLNAAIQGTRGLMRGAKNNPGTFTYKMAQLGAVSTSLYIANYLTNPECWQSITDREKEANFIITTPIYFTDDKGQKKYYYMKIAKDQGHRVVTSLFDSLMAKQFEGKFPTQQTLMGFQDLISVAGIPPTFAAGISYLMNKDTWTNEDVWKGPEGIEAKEEYRKTTHPFWVSVGQSIGLSPERMSNAAGKVIPPNNPFVGMVGGGYKILTGDLPQEIQDKSAAQFITEIPSVRRVLSTTNPYTPYRENIEDIKKTEATRTFIQNRTFDDLANQYLKTKDNKVAEAMLNYAVKLSEVDQDRLTRRFEHNARLYNVPDRAWYMTTLSLPPEAKAIVFYDRFSKSNRAEQQQMLEIADRVGGFESERFIEKVAELMSRHTQGALTSQ